MSDFQVKYESLVSRVQSQRENDLAALTNLQQLYKDTMDCEDPLINARIRTITSAYDSKRSKLEEQRRHFAQVMSLTDAQLRIAHSNDWIQFEEDEVYAEHETHRARIKDRTLLESEYWSAVFPINETNTPLTIDQFLPHVAEPTFVTVGDELSGQSIDSALSQQITKAMDYVKNHVGTLYDLSALTRKELLELDAGLRQYMAADSSSRIEHMSNFITPRFSDDQWGRLTNSERDTLTYTRKRDADSASGEFCRMTAEREETLARIILRMYDQMVEGNTLFRTPPQTPSDHISHAPHASAVFYVENFLVEKVRARREPLYARAIDQNLPEVLKFHRQMRGILGPSEIASLRVDYPVKKMYNLMNWLSTHRSLTPKQRRFAKSLMKEYVIRVKNSSVWTQEKVRCLAAAQEAEQPSTNI